MESKAEIKQCAGPELDDLSKGAKSLRHTENPQEHAEAKTLPEDLEPYRKLFHEHNGNLRAIFDDLGEDPGKALKYPPANADEFARVYVNGGYTYLLDVKSDRK
ncbi:unnamed protein product [Ascophyllum nodosum]